MNKTSFEKGIEKGIEKGREMAYRDSLRERMEEKFGVLPADVDSKLLQLGLDDLLRLNRTLRQAKSLHDLGWDD